MTTAEAQTWNPDSGGRFLTWGPLELPGFPERRIRVYIPGGSTPVSERPALYLFDGQNVFGDEGSFAGGWWAHAAVERSATPSRDWISR